MGITITRPVTIKVIMTEPFREQLLGEARDTIRRIEENLRQLERDSTQYLSSLDPQHPAQAASLRQRYEEEKGRLLKMKGELEWRIKEVEGVSLGAELPFRVFDGPVEIRVGDDFLKKIARAEIVMKDWQVMEIREG